MRILSRQDLLKLVTMKDAIQAVGDAFADLSGGTAQAPVRTVVPGTDSTTLLMPARLSKPPLFSVKIVSVAPKNPERGLARIQAAVVTVDPKTGQPYGLVEGASLTALRTGASSGVATKLLAKKKVKQGIVYGAGPNGLTQVLAIDAVREFDEILLVSRSLETAKAGVKDLKRKTRSEVRAAEPGQSVADADVICAATNASTPLFDGRKIPAGCHVNGIGSFRPDVQEIDEHVLRRASKIVVDQREAVWHEAGDLIIARDRGVIKESSVYAELGEIWAGTKKGRERDDEITFFKSVGNAVQDGAVAALALRRAKEKRVGKVVDLL